MKHFSLSLAFIFVAVFNAPAEAAFELVTNGDFSGGLTGWTVTDQAGGSGSWVADTVGTTTPISGEPTSAGNLAGSAAAGTYAVSDQTGPGAHALEQSFTVPGAASSVTLSFDMFINNFDGGPTANPAGLDYTAIPNEHGRVDILSTGSGAFDTGAGVLANYFIGGATGGIPNPFAHFSFDITGLAGAGGTFDLRFAEADNQNFFNFGVDNVSVTYSPAAVPEASSLIIWSLLGSTALVVTRRQSKA